MDKTLFDSMIRDIYQNRKPDGIKSDFGKVLIIGGSKPYPLSVCIADKFASLSGVVATEDGSWTIKGFIDAYKTFIPFLLIRKLFLKF